MNIGMPFAAAPAATSPPATIASSEVKPEFTPPPQPATADELIDWLYALPVPLQTHAFCWFKNAQRDDMPVELCLTLGQAVRHLSVADKQAVRVALGVEAPSSDVPPAPPQQPQPAAPAPAAGAPQPQAPRQQPQPQQPQPVPGFQQDSDGAMQRNWELFQASDIDELTTQWYTTGSTQKHILDELKVPLNVPKLGQRSDSTISTDAVQRYSAWLDAHFDRLFPYNLQCIMWALPKLKQPSVLRTARVLLPVPEGVVAKAELLVERLRSNHASITALLNALLQGLRASIHGEGPLARLFRCCTHFWPCT
jgi:hypothetical protein